MVLKCGHHEACMYRFRDAEGMIHKYCMACICIKSGTLECDAPRVKEVSQPVEEVPVKKSVKQVK